MTYNPARNSYACWALAIAVLRYRLLVERGQHDEAKAHADYHGIPERARC